MTTCTCINHSVLLKKIAHSIGNCHCDMRLSALDALSMLLPFGRRFGGGRGFGFPSTGFELPAEDISEVDFAE